MKLSLVIPAYNEEQYIAACLQSIFDQHKIPDEVIVVNNNSSDQTKDIASQFPVRIIDEHRQGISYARTAGFDAAQYDIIARTDADTQLPPDWTQRVFQHFEQQSIDALTGTAVMDGLWFLDRHPLPINLFLDLLQLAQGGGQILMGANMAMTKDMWNRVCSLLCHDDHLVHDDIHLAQMIRTVGGRIHRDRSLVCKTSARRILQNPSSFLFEYPLRLIKTSFRSRNMRVPTR